MGLIENISNKPVKKTRHIEHDLQVLCVRWFRNTYPNYIIFSTNNECTRGKQYWKDSGMLDGVSDLVIVIPNKIIWIELKSDIGRQRPDQKHFEDKIKGLGFEYYIVRSLEEFKKIISNEF